MLPFPERAREAHNRAHTKPHWNNWEALGASNWSNNSWVSKVEGVDKKFLGLFNDTIITSLEVFDILLVFQNWKASSIFVMISSREMRPLNCFSVCCEIINILLRKRNSQNHNSAFFGRWRVNSAEILNRVFSRKKLGNPLRREGSYARVFDSHVALRNRYDLAALEANCVVAALVVCVHDQTQRSIAFRALGKAHQPHLHPSWNHHRLKHNSWADFQKYVIEVPPKSIWHSLYLPPLFEKSPINKGW